MKRIIKNGDIETVFVDDSFTFIPLESNDEIKVKYSDVIKLIIDDLSIIARINDDDGKLKTYTIPFDQEFEKEARAIVAVVNRNILRKDDVINMTRTMPEIPVVEPADQTQNIPPIENIPMDQPGQAKKMQVHRIIYIVCAVISLLYCIYSIWYVFDTTSNVEGSAEAIGVGIAVYLAIPHLLVMFVGTLVNWFAAILTNKGCALASAILYTVAIFLMPVWFMFVIIQMILMYVGFGIQLHNQNKKI